MNVYFAGEVEDLAINLGICMDQTTIKEDMTEQVKNLSAEERQKMVHLLEVFVNLYRVNERFQKLTHGGVTFVSETCGALTRLLKNIE